MKNKVRKLIRALYHNWQPLSILVLMAIIILVWLLTNIAERQKYSHYSPLDSYQS